MQELQVRYLGWEETPGEEMATPLQYSCLENPMDRGAWWATVHEVTKSRTELSNLAHVHMYKSVTLLTLPEHR